MSEATRLVQYAIRILEKINSRLDNATEEKNKEVKLHNRKIDSMQKDISEHKENISYYSGAEQYLLDLKTEIAQSISDELGEIEK